MRYNERLYDYIYRKGTIDNMDVHEILDIKKRKGQYSKGKNDLFAVVIVLKYMLSMVKPSVEIGELEK